VAALRKVSPDVVILDIKMPGKSGIEGLPEIRSVDPLVSVVMLTGFGSLQTAQQAMRNGANDYVRKPFDTREMRETVAHHVERTRLERRRARASTDLADLNMRMREELERQEHLADLGRRSSEFVHDLRNPLTVIYGYVDLLLAELRDAESMPAGGNSERAEYLEIIEKNLQRCEGMLAQWKQLREDGAEGTRTRLSVSTMLGEIAEGAVPVAGRSGVRVQLQPAPLDAEIEGNETDIYRALQNLVTNAIQAMGPDGGLVELGWRTDEKAVTIWVRDTGPGIPVDKLDKILTPYFTTKQESGGMGLGLCITQTVAEAHGGSFTLGNAPEGGAIAHVRLPVASR
jgi:signal transduction histidine kinase